MREIKFRAKRIDNSEWIYGNLIILNSGYYIVDTDYYNTIDIELGTSIEINALWEDNDFFKVDMNTISQFTGLYDKNGKEIYENDIVKDILGYVGVVTYSTKHSAFVVKGWEDGYRFWHDKNIKVIGNIFDNPELLGEQQ